MQARDDRGGATMVRERKKSWGWPTMAANEKRRIEGCGCATKRDGKGDVYGGRIKEGRWLTML